jgi:ketosteroid isomerase-like protein
LNGKLARFLLMVVCLLASHVLARADEAADKAAITERLRGWTDAFNAQNQEIVCDLFAPDLIATIPDVADDSRDALCARIKAAQAKPDLQLHYDYPEILEILVSGDLAVVRLFWTLTTRRGIVEDTTVELGIDVFKRQSDGKWRIARYLSFTNRANKNLP